MELCLTLFAKIWIILGKKYEMPVFTGFSRLQKDHNGVSGVTTAAQGLERCDGDDNGAGGLLSVREDQ